ncbi:hypothetical protein MSPP1_000950 [Malassezia sp. CBS 17886]|nr:hypothetical protein MSPP1_000950 [Malassezia sp. CBS 17886]
MVDSGAPGHAPRTAAYADSGAQALPPAALPRASRSLSPGDPWDALDGDASRTSSSYTTSYASRRPISALQPLEARASTDTTRTSLLDAHPTASGAPRLTFKSADLRSALHLQEAQKSKLYMEGYLLVRHAFSVDGQPDNRAEHFRSWTECFVQLNGTVLSIWDAHALRMAEAEGREVPPSFINITDAVADFIGLHVEAPFSEPGRRLQLYHVFAVNSAGSNRVLFCFSEPPPCDPQMVDQRISVKHQHHPEHRPVVDWLNRGQRHLQAWINAIRLASWERSRLDEIYTGALIRARLSAVKNMQPGLPAASAESELLVRSPLVKGRHEGWVRARFMGSTEWRRCWMVLHSHWSDDEPTTGLRRFLKRGAPGDRSSLLSLAGSTAGHNALPTTDVSEPPPPPAGVMASPAVAYFYESKKTKRPFASLWHARSVFAVYPSRPDLVESSVLFKVEGALPQSTAVSATHRQRATGWIMFLPEIRAPSSRGANAEMMKWIIAFMDAFRLYGRPGQFVWDARNPASPFFAYPIGPHKDHLFLDRALTEFLDISVEDHLTTRQMLNDVMAARMRGEDTPMLPPLSVPRAAEPMGGQSTAPALPEPQSETPSGAPGATQSAFSQPPPPSKEDLERAAPMTRGPVPGAPSSAPLPREVPDARRGAPHSEPLPWGPSAHGGGQPNANVYAGRQADANVYAAQQADPSVYGQQPDAITYAAQQADPGAYATQAGDPNSYGGQQQDANVYAGRQADANVYAAQQADPSAYAGQQSDSAAYTGQQPDPNLYTGRQPDPNVYAGRQPDPNMYAAQQADPEGAAAMQHPAQPASPQRVATRTDRPTLTASMFQPRAPGAPATGSPQAPSVHPTSAMTVSSAYDTDTSFPPTGAPVPAPEDTWAGGAGAVPGASAAREAAAAPQNPRHEQIYSWPAPAAAAARTDAAAATPAAAWGPPSPATQPASGAGGLSLGAQRNTDLSPITEVSPTHQRLHGADAKTHRAPWSGDTDSRAPAARPVEALPPSAGGLSQGSVGASPLSPPVTVPGLAFLAPSISHGAPTASPVSPPAPPPESPGGGQPADTERSMPTSHGASLGVPAGRVFSGGVAHGGATRLSHAGPTARVPSSAGDPAGRLPSGAYSTESGKETRLVQEYIDGTEEVAVPLSTLAIAQPPAASEGHDASQEDNSDGAAAADAAGGGMRTAPHDEPRTYPSSFGHRRAPERAGGGATQSAAHMQPGRASAAMGAPHAQDWVDYDEPDTSLSSAPPQPVPAVRMDASPSSAGHLAYAIPPSGSGTSFAAPYQKSRSSSSLAQERPRQTFVRLDPEDRPGGAASQYVPQGLIASMSQDRLDRSAHTQELEARESGSALVNVPNKPPPPQAGLMGAIHSRDRRAASTQGHSERERPRPPSALGAPPRPASSVQHHGAHTPMTQQQMYMNMYYWQQQQQQQMMMMMGMMPPHQGPPGVSRESMMAQQQAMQAAQQAYFQAMAQASGGQMGGPAMAHPAGPMPSSASMGGFGMPPSLSGSSEPMNPYMMPPPMMGMPPHAHPGFRYGTPEMQATRSNSPRASVQGHRGV